MSSNKYQKTNIFCFEIIWNRVSNATDIKNQNDLARIVGVSQGAISGRKSKNLWPEEWAYRIGTKYNLLTEWILTGKGPKRVSDIDNQCLLNFPVLKDLEQWLNEIVIDEPFRKDWFKGNIEDAFPKFKEWMKRKEKKHEGNNISQNSKVA